jgi:hypothetical protein
MLRSCQAANPLAIRGFRSLLHRTSGLFAAAVLSKAV